MRSMISFQPLDLFPRSIALFLKLCDTSAELSDFVGLIKVRFVNNSVHFTFPYLIWHVLQRLGLLP